MAWHSKIASEGRPVQAASASARRVWTTFVVIKLSSRFNFIVLQVLSNLTVLWIFQLSNDIRPDPNKLLICQQYQNYYKRIISDTGLKQNLWMRAQKTRPVTVVASAEHDRLQVKTMATRARFFVIWRLLLLLIPVFLNWDPNKLPPLIVAAMTPL